MTPKQQLRRTRIEQDRSRKKAAREHLRQLRARIRDARKRKAMRLREVARECKTARERNRARARRARERLQQSIVRTRQRAKSICELARATVKKDGLADIDRHVAALNQEVADQRVLKVWTEPKRAEPSRKERRAESDDEVRNNIDDPGLRIVFEKVKHKIKASPRRTRTEAFFEWAHDHSADVYAIQEAQAVAELEALEAEERKLARALKKARVARELEAVPF